MPFRARTVVSTIPLVAALVLGLAPVAPPSSAAAAGEKVVIIVGPVGAQTDNYREKGDRIAETAEAAGADVVKVYSPNATWDNVREAVDGANIIVYVGHGNGYPNPYSSGTEYTDRVNGWGLNMREDDGDGDTINRRHGLLRREGAAWSADRLRRPGRRTYCGGTANDGITPAPGFVMIYSNACYTPGAGESFDTPATEATALTRVASYSRPVFALGGRAYFASDLGLVEARRPLASQPGNGLRRAVRDEQRVRRGRPSRAPASALRRRSPGLAPEDRWPRRPARLLPRVRGQPFHDPERNDDLLRAHPDPPPFSDMVGSKFFDDIVWLADEGITSGCGGTKFCPNGSVTRGQMATFLVRAFDLPATGPDYFADDSANKHEANINAPGPVGHHVRLRRRPLLSRRARHPCPDGDLPDARRSSSAGRAPTTSTMTTTTPTSRTSTASRRPTSRRAAARIGTVPTGS